MNTSRQHDIICVFLSCRDYIVKEAKKRDTGCTVSCTDIKAVSIQHNHLLQCSSKCVQFARPCSSKCVQFARPCSSKSVCSSHDRAVVSVCSSHDRAVVKVCAVRTTGSSDVILPN